MIITKEHKRHNTGIASTVKNVVGGGVGVAVPSIPVDKLVIQTAL
jgi:hypothetical protein